MTCFFFFYQIFNVLLIAGALYLLKLLYDRLEIVENRNLFIAVIGLGIDLIAWYSISHSKSVASALIILRLSLVGRTLFGVGFLCYVMVTYKPRLTKYIFFVWILTIFSSFGYTFFPENSYGYISDPHFITVYGVATLCGKRGLMYFLHVGGVMLMGIWNIVVILKSMIKGRTKGERVLWLNDVFYLIAIMMQGTVYMIYQLNYYRIPNITPIFRAFATAIYAVLSLRYHILNFDSLARKSLMNEVGAGFIVLSDKYEMLYVNEVAISMVPEVTNASKYKRILKKAISKGKFQFERNHRTYRATCDRILTKGHLEGYTVLIIDITDLALLESRTEAIEEARKNLLTNISHELKTPLNAIVGAAETLRVNDLSEDEYKEYAEVIRVSTMDLNDILSDILTASEEYEKNYAEDFVPYSVCTLLDNVVDMCKERVLKERVNFSVNISKSIPINALGDDKRIRQILLSVLSSVIRSMDAGSVELSISGEYLTEDRFQYLYTIKDNGRNVFKEDIDLNGILSSGNELGVDYTTGYGISLMVAKRIARLLEGDLHVYSDENGYNVYTLKIPSMLIEKTTLADLKLDEKFAVYRIGELDSVFAELSEACTELGIENERFFGINAIRRLTKDKEKASVLVFDYDRFGKRIPQSERAKGYKWLAVLEGGDVPSDKENDFIFVRKPLSLLTLYKLFKELETQDEEEESAKDDRAFVVTGARILVVDDNSLNLQVASNILEHFKATVDVCGTGYECLEKIESGEVYDLIFMDYMMEGMDGVETTKRIRALSLPMKDVPILAYTANTVDGSREKYIAEGMNGCVFKPASTNAFADALRTYLPESKIIYEAIVEKEQSSEYEGYPDIEGVDKETAARYSGGNATLYREMLATFSGAIPENEEKILGYIHDDNIKNFVVQVHGIKGLARTLGMEGLADRMASLEKAGSNGDYEFIKNNLSGILSYYRRYKILLEPFVGKKQEEVMKHVPADKVEATLVKMLELLEDFEIDDTEKLFEEIWPGDYDEERKPLMEGLKESIERVDYYASKDYIESLLKTYNN